MSDVPASVYFEVRTNDGSSTNLEALKEKITDVNPDLQILLAHTVSEMLDFSSREPNTIAWLCTVFGMVALLLAATDLCGVLSYTVGRRTNEIGIRMALGAGKQQVLLMILRETAKLVAIGTGAGLAAVATVAASLPAVSAARTNPLTALRHE